MLPGVTVTLSGVGAQQTTTDSRGKPPVPEPGNVGGSQSGQQSGVVGKGADSTHNAWNADGVTITDMASTGLSPTCYDFDALQEMQATTGGSDPSIAVPGVTLNMVTRRDTNEVHGSARIFDTGNKFQAKPGYGSRRLLSHSQAIPGRGPDGDKSPFHHRADALDPAAPIALRGSGDPF